MSGIFDKYESEAWPITYRGAIRVGLLSGGVPMDPKVVKSWIRTKLRDTRSDAEVAQLIASTMASMAISEDEAIDHAVDKGLMAGMNGFKHDDNGLFVEGRMLKAMLKEAVSCAAAAGKLEMTGWGKTRKFLTNYLPEHVFVDEETLYLYKGGEVDPKSGLYIPGKHVMDPDGKNQKFIHTFRGDSIGYEQFVRGAEVAFTIKTDHPFTERDWAMILLTGEKEGFGASRSQGWGVFELISWVKTQDTLAEKKARARRAKAAKKDGFAGSGMDDQALAENGIRE
jgi:hypothetical protein